MRGLAFAAAILVSAAAVQAAERHRAPSADAARQRAEQAQRAEKAARNAAQAERDRAASEVASRQAASRAAAAAAQERTVAQQRVAAAARLSAAELATNAAAERIAELEQERRSAEAALQARAAEMGPLLPLIERVSLFPAETMLAVPQPADRALTAVLVLRGMAARLNKDAAGLRAEEARLAELTQAEQAETPRLARAQAEQARLAAELDRQLAEAARTRGAAADEAALAARRAAEAAARATTLEGVLAEIERAPAPPTASPPPPPAASPPASQEAAARPLVPPLLLSPGGLFTAPVAGSIVRKWGDATPAGAATGLSWQAAPLARVVAPCSGRAVFAAPFRSYGQLVILDCGGGIRLVLAGMQRLDVQPGARLTQGEPVGEMPDWDPHWDPHRDPQAAAGRPTLYFELRRGALPVDPAPYLHGQG